MADSKKLDAIAEGFFKRMSEKNLENKKKQMEKQSKYTCSECGHTSQPVPVDHSEQAEGE